jgi:methyl halide transferase
MDHQYWENRYIENDTPWSLHQANPALIRYMEDKNRDASILIPGAGTSYEVIELFNMGFTNLTICDISGTALSLLEKTVEKILQKDHSIRFVHGDFFSLTEQFDYIIEQTFFCALLPEKREEYVRKMFDLLRDNGTLFGVLFATPFSKPGPPFGGEINEYKSLLSKLFYIKEISMCTHSVKPRQGNELFFICKKLVNPHFL